MSNSTRQGHFSLQNLKCMIMDRNEHLSGRRLEHCKKYEYSFPAAVFKIDH